jgi:hypothetical protein
MTPEPELSVVVASVNGLPYLARCLEALQERAPEAEVVVADWTDEPTRALVRERWPQVRLLSFERPMAVPELRAAGIAEARAPYVAVIEDHCVVQPGWSAAVLRGHRAGHAVVGGEIINVVTGRLRDWAAFYCEYSEHMDPLPAGPTPSLPGMNVSYDRAALAAMAPLLAEGRWETWLHPHLEREGFAFHVAEGMVLGHDKDFGFREFASQRWHYARSHAGIRNPELGARRLIYAAGSPLIVPLMLKRIVRNVRAKPRHRRRFAQATPLVVVYLGVWAAGEAVGYLLGGGRSLLKVR